MRIMLVDDEPIFINQLKKIITRFSDESDPSIQVVAECYSSEEALQLIGDLSLDVVFTDIRMSSIDGIDLARAIQKRWPSIQVVIISGYPSFEFAREAMRVNVVDYILKPIEPAAIKQVLDKLRLLLEGRSYERSSELLRTLLLTEHKSPLPETIKQATFPYSGYLILLIQNILTPFDNHLWLPQNGKGDDKFREGIRQNLNEPDEVWLFHSDYSREFIAIVGINDWAKINMPAILQYSQAHFSLTGLSASIAYSEQITELSELHPWIPKLKQLLYKNMVIGMPKLVSVSTESGEDQNFQSLFSETDEKQIMFMLTKTNWAPLKSFIMNLFSKWESKECPSIYVEKYLNSIVRMAEKPFLSPDPLLSKSLKSRIEEIVYSAASFQEAADAYWSMIMHIFKPNETETGTNSRAALYSQIEIYLASHLSEPLTLANLTDSFNVSSTYLCNLFRDFSGKSFVEYFTGLRMRKAKDLIRDYPEMLLKDIAQIIGYADQNYFSRVFKTIEGVNPKDYKASHMQ